MGCKGTSLRLLNIENKHRQISLFRDLTVQLTQSSCCTVSWIGKGLLSQQFLLRIHCIKSFIGHVNLPTDLNIWNRMLQLLLHIFDYPGILCDIFSLNDAIASGNGRGHDTVRITNCHGQSIDLCLYYKLWMIQLLLHALYELHDLFFGKHILKAEHRHSVTHQYTSFSLSRSSHMLCGRIWCNPLRMLCLQLLQFLHQHIVFIICDLWIVLIIITINVIIDNFP